ncbi:RAD1 and NH2 terminal ERCC4-like helicase domain [Cryptosporidium canis]|uniref:RAD1 and NH2 terminal ERCC4-like helicase domain n=1 Tax=Cryptosporidium canis TaxID=195482 RepID=A0A9D5HY00_9CRYT|nr:RAD1 and NH2 terminal ERCC4-like helicase domain [Cryptosporidium canis]
MQLLPFQQSIQNDIRNNKSCLIVLSKGLGTFHVIYNYLSTLEISTGNIIIILNLSLPEIESFKLFALSMDYRQDRGNPTEMIDNNTILSKKLIIINSGVNLSRRKEFYHRGGIFIVTSRILLTDLLSERLEISSIKGMVVFNAESLNIRNWNDAFILQLYKSKHPNGFIKGISQRPEILNQGYFGPGVAMRYLGTVDLFLYPRTHISVNDSLKYSRGIKVIEKAVRATENFYEIQKCIQILIEKGLHEIFKLDPNIELNLCELLYYSPKKLKNKIESITQDLWCKMTFRLHQIAKDIVSMRSLLDLLYLLDAVEFFFYLEYLRSSKLIDPSWILTTEFESLYKASRSRIFKVNNGKGKSNDQLECPFSLCLEVNPIHIQLFDVILNLGKELTKEEISILIQENGSSNYISIGKNINDQTPNQVICEEFDENENDDDKSGDSRRNEQNVEIYSKLLNCNIIQTKQLPEYRVLLVVPDDLCFNIIEIEQLLLNGPQYFSTMKLTEILQNIETGLSPPQSNIISKAMPFFGIPACSDSSQKSNSLHQLRLIFSKLIKCSSDNQHTYSFKDTVIHSINSKSIPERNYLDEIIENNGINPKIIISYSNANIQGKFWNAISSYSPHLIVMLDPEISIIREIELYAAIFGEKSKIALKVILLTIQNSIRHERFLDTIKNEEISWESLERHKKTLVVPLSDFTENEILSKLSFSSINQDKPEHENGFQRVIVDIREFRSPLPYQLFCKGIKVIPMTLEIGDYVISRDVCIERKSLQDLINSLNNGRLFTQLQWISRHYSVPVILIELNQLTEQLNHHGKQHNFTPIKSNSLDIYTKLILLVRHIPNIKFVWSSNSSFSSLIILRLKNNREQPNLQIASTINTGILDINYNDITVDEYKKTVKKGKKRKFTSDTSKSSYYATTFLMHLPGINSKNIKVITSKFCSIKEIFNASLETLTYHLGASNGTSLFRTLHEDCSEIYV